MNTPLVVRASLVAAAIFACAREPGVPPPLPPVAVSLVNGEPALVFDPTDSLSIRISAVTYNDFGRIRSYAVDAKAPGGNLVGVVSVIDHPAPDSARALLRRAAGDSSWSVPADSLHYLITLLPHEPGALRLREAQSVSTDATYDRFGRRQTAGETFRLGSARWRVRFVDYVRDGAGRITALTTRFSRER